MSRRRRKGISAPVRDDNAFEALYAAALEQANAFVLTASRIGHVSEMERAAQRYERLAGYIASRRRRHLLRLLSHLSQEIQGDG